MKLTLLEIVQDIMNDMDGEVVNSISDTIESNQVAQIIKSTFMEFTANRNWPHLHKGFSLQSSADPLYPTSLTLPENIKELKWVKYNKRSTDDTKDKYERVQYMQPEDFFETLAARDSSASNVQIVNHDGLKLNVRTDKAPEFWTTFDDAVLVFDSFDSAVDSTLQSGKTSCWGVRNPTWSHSDASIPDLPSEAFPGFIEEAKSTCFYTLRQAANEKAEQKATRQNRWLARKAWRVKGGIRTPDYGRKKAFSGHERNPLLDKG